MKKFAGLVALSLIVSVNAAAADAPATASAAAGKPEAAENTGRATSFGHAGQILVYASTSANLGGTFQTDTFNFQVAPAAAYFVNDTFFVGGELVLDITAVSNAATTTVFEIGPVGGFNFALGNNFSAIPQLGLLVGVFSQSNNGPSFNQTTFNINIDGNFAYHVVPHFSFIFGPYFHQAVGDATLTSLGVNFGVLGWL